MEIKSKEIPFLS